MGLFVGGAKMRWTKTWTSSWRAGDWQADDWRGHPASSSQHPAPALASVPRPVKRRRLDGPTPPEHPPPRAVQESFAEEPVVPPPGSDERIEWVLEVKEWLRHTFSVAEFDVLMSREA